MKRALTILLLTVFSFNFLGASFVYNIWLYSIRESVKEQIEGEYEEEKTLIKVPLKWSENPPPEFKWHEDHEFEYRGQMYDIIRKEQRGNQMWYYCHWDKAETELLKNLSEYVSNYLQQHPKDNQKTTSLTTYLDKIFLVASRGHFLEAQRNAKLFAPYNLISDSIFWDVDEPPPRPTMSSLPIRLVV